MRDQKYFQKLNQIRQKYDFLNQLSQENAHTAPNSKSGEAKSNRNSVSTNLDHKQVDGRSPLCAKPFNEMENNNELKTRRQQLNISNTPSNKFQEKQTLPPTLQIELSNQQQFATRQRENAYPFQQKETNNNKIQKMSLQNKQISPPVSINRPQSQYPAKTNQGGEYSVQKLNASINSIDSLQKRIQGMLNKR